MKYFKFKKDKTKKPLILLEGNRSLDKKFKMPLKFIKKVHETVEYEEFFKIKDRKSTRLNSSH